MRKTGPLRAGAQPVMPSPPIRRFVECRYRKDPDIVKTQLQTSKDPNFPKPSYTRPDPIPDSHFIFSRAVGASRTRDSPLLQYHLKWFVTVSTLITDFSRNTLLSSGLVKLGCHHDGTSIAWNTSFQCRRSRRVTEAAKQLPR